MITHHSCILRVQPPGPRRPPGPPPIQAPSQRQPDAAAAHMQPPAPPGGFAPGPQAHLGQPPSSSPHIGSADLSQQGPYGRSSQPNGAEAPPGQVAIRKEPSLERTTSNSSSAHHILALCVDALGTLARESYSTGGKHGRRNVERENMENNMSVACPFAMMVLMDVSTTWHSVVCFID
jgi:hypothetical protein